jgi:hypothetical protein
MQVDVQEDTEDPPLGDSGPDNQDDVQEDTEDPPLGDSGPDNQDDVQEDMEVSPLGDSEVEDVLPAWQEYLPMQGDTAAGTSSNAKSTAGQYKRFHKVWISVQASLTTATLTRHNLTSKDLYLPGGSDDYVNSRLARLFVKYYVEIQDWTITNFGAAINYLVLQTWQEGPLCKQVSQWGQR